MSKAKVSIKTEYEFDGRTYSILSRSSKNLCKVSFGDVLAIYCNQFMNTENISAFILTHIAKRKEDGKDQNRDAFLNALVAKNILKKVKVGSENGYMIIQKPTYNDFKFAWDYSNELHDNGRNFEAFKDNDTLLAGAAKKSSRLMTLLVSNLIRTSLPCTEVKLSELISRLMDVYTESTAKKIVNCLAVNGAIEIYYFYESGELVNRVVQFNRLPLYADDLQNYAKYSAIPASCASHVHRIDRDVTSDKTDIKYFESFNELQKFYTDNITYLIKNNKLPEKDY